jgi:hypothetical protein
MKFTKIALAVTVLLAAQNASAFDVYVSGASALRDTMPRLMDKFCKPNATAARTLREVGADKDRRAYSCTFHDNASNAAVAAELGATLAGKQVNVFHSVEPGNAFDNAVGGSITGIIPLLNGSPVLLNFANLDGTANGTDSTFAGASKFNSTQAPHDSQIGLSDVEPKMFSAAFGNLPTNAAAVAAGWKLPAGHTAAELTSEVAFIGGFGIAVSQAGVANGLTNISTDQLAAVLAGDITDVQQLGLATSQEIVVCRRTPGSGTQATFNALISHLGCGANSAGAQFSVASHDGVGVIENATTGNVKTCLTAANTAGKAGIGILGLENKDVDPTYQIIDINGVKIWDVSETAGNTVDGTVDNVREEKIISGEYPLWVESTVQKSTKVSLSAEQNAFYTLLKDKAGDPLFTKSLPGIVSDTTKRTGNLPNLDEGAINYSRAGNTCKPASFAP